MWYVYFLELKNGDIYVGSTNDLRRRFDSHQQGSVVSTRMHLPAILRSYVAVNDEANARRLKKYFKSGSGKGICQKTLPCEGLILARCPRNQDHPSSRPNT